MRISYIIPSYNAEPYLERCVETLYMQDIAADEFEVIIVNDGSTDGTEEVAQRIASLHSNVKCISQVNQGLSASRNAGMQQAIGDYYSFIDADDFLIPHTMKRVLETAEKKQVEVCKFALYSEYSGWTSIRNSPQSLPKDVITGEQAMLMDLDINSACNVIYSSKFIKAYDLKFTVGILHEDVDFNAQVCFYAKRMLFMKNLVYYYYYNNKSITKSSNAAMEVKRFKSNVKYLERCKELAAKPEASTSLRELFSNRANSATVGLLLRLMKNKSIPVEEKQSLFALLEEKGLYPIKGKTMSWKSTAMLPLLNRRAYVLRKIGKK